jgi:hypothetical protein
MNERGAFCPEHEKPKQTIFPKNTVEQAQDSTARCGLSIESSVSPMTKL